MYGFAPDEDRADLQHVQDDLRILRIVPVPSVVQCLERAGERDRGDQLQFETGEAVASRVDWGCQRRR